VDIETLAQRISEEAVDTGTTVMWVTLVDAIARKPAQK
jgi:hypothetical protein